METVQMIKGILAVFFSKGSRSMKTDTALPWNNLDYFKICLCDIY